MRKKVICENHFIRQFIRIRQQHPLGFCFDKKDTEKYTHYSM